MINDPLGDMLARILNAQMRRRPKVVMPASNLRARVLDVLAEEGYIRGYTRVDHKGALSELEVELKYSNGMPAIREIVRASKPNQRVYSPTRKFSSVTNSVDAIQRMDSTSTATKNCIPPFMFFEDSYGNGVAIGAVEHLIESCVEISAPKVPPIEADVRREARANTEAVSDGRAPNNPLFAPSQDVAARELDDAFGQWVTGIFLRGNLVRK